MPCYDPSADDEERARVARERAFFRSALCAVLSLDESVIERIDEQETGVAKEDLRAWWERHKASDAARREREREAREAEAARLARVRELIGPLSAGDRELLRQHFRER